MSTTSLLKSASNIREQMRRQEDQMRAFEWSLSAKTYNDFLDYQKYLESRQAQAASPSDKLGYAKDIISARKSYTSNEIQRSSIDIIEGNGTSTEKYNKMVQLFYQAVDAGDFDSAQSLHLQLDNLSVKIQNEQESASRAAGTLAMNQVTSLKDLKSKITKGQGGINLPDGGVIKTIPDILDEYSKNGQTEFGLFNEIGESLNVFLQATIEAYNGATTQEAADKIASDLLDINPDGTASLKGTFSIGGKDLTYQDVQVAKMSENANNPIYSPTATLDPATGELKFKLTENKIDNIIWIRNDAGEYSAIQERTPKIDPYQTLDTQITDDGFVIDKNGHVGNGNTVTRNDSLSIRARLEAMGITILDSNKSDAGMLNLLVDGVRVQGTIEPDGTVRYFGAPGQYSGSGAGMYEINILNGQTREVAPDETSDFGIQSQFGGLISKASEAGKGYMDSFLGKNISKYTPVDLSKSIIGIGNDFTGKNTPLLGFNVQGASSVLQAAGGIRDRIAAEQAQREAALKSAMQLAQAATAFNLNQTPVRQFAQNGAPVRQLSVTPVKTPTINTVSVAAPQPNIRPVTTSNTGLGVSNFNGFSLQGGNGIRL